MESRDFNQDERLARLFTTLKIAAEHWSDVEIWPYQATFHFDTNDDTGEGVMTVTLPEMPYLADQQETFLVTVKRIKLAST